jgi:hypothetical protein
VTIDERLEALTLAGELHMLELENQRQNISLLATVVADLAKLAESHERRLYRLEG